MDCSPNVGHIGRHMILCSGIEIILGPQYRWFCTSIELHKPMPMAIVLLTIDNALEYIPSPSVHSNAERQ